MPKQIRNNYTDRQQEDLRSFMLPLYITRISKVVDIDTGEEWKLDLLTKLIYGYFTGIGYTMGYNSVYPNQDKIAEHLCTTQATVSKKISNLVKIGLIKKNRVRVGGQWESNHYWIKRPNMIDRRRWIDNNGDVLRGKHYNFDYSIFNKVSSECNNDKLLQGFLKLVEKECANKE